MIFSTSGLQSSLYIRDVASTAGNSLNLRYKDRYLELCGGFEKRGAPSLPSHSTLPSPPPFFYIGTPVRVASKGGYQKWSTYNKF
jgi:hypothetical protein